MFSSSLVGEIVAAAEQNLSATAIELDGKRLEGWPASTSASVAHATSSAGAPRLDRRAFGQPMTDHATEHARYDQGNGASQPVGIQRGAGQPVTDYAAAWDAQGGDAPQPAQPAGTQRGVCQPRPDATAGEAGRAQGSMHGATPGAADGHGRSELDAIREVLWQNTKQGKKTLQAALTEAETDEARHKDAVGVAKEAVSAANEAVGAARKRVLTLKHQLKESQRQVKEHERQMEESEGDRLEKEGLLATSKGAADMLREELKNWDDCEAVMKRLIARPYKEGAATATTDASGTVAEAPADGAPGGSGVVHAPRTNRGPVTPPGPVAAGRTRDRDADPKAEEQTKAKERAVKKRRREDAPNFAQRVRGDAEEGVGGGGEGSPGGGGSMVQDGAKGIKDARKVI